MEFNAVRSNSDDVVGIFMASFCSAIIVTTHNEKSHKRVTETHCKSWRKVNNTYGHYMPDMGYKFNLCHNLFRGNFVLTDTSAIF
jgi:hypothetical protein